MVLVESKTDPKGAYEFEAELTPFGITQPITITNKYQPVVNSLTMRQICRLVIMKPPA
jgi:GTPase